MLWGLLLMALNDRQQLFVEEYLLDLNATQAAIRAGYAESTADKKAPLWVGKSRDSCPENMRHVWDAVNEAKTARSERTGIDADYVLRRLVEIDQMDVADILQADGSLKAIQDWPKVWRQYIAGMDLAEMFEGSALVVAQFLRLSPGATSSMRVGCGVMDPSPLRWS